LVRLPQRPPDLAEAWALAVQQQVRAEDPRRQQCYPDGRDGKQYRADGDFEPR
jgi:hypothetical protein